MKTKEFVRAIKKIIKEEVAKQVKQVLSEQTANNNKASLSEEYKTLKTFSAADARAGFTAFQDQPQQDALSTPDVNGRPMDPSRVPDSVKNALTRDYSELVKKFK
tara:strand:- start:11031 stop:11345 length:315 start_codon:yes stop_codon:yes gene_type:complete